MGQLGFWGAVAGAGKGLDINATEMDKKQMAELAAQKEAALINLRAQHESEQQQRGFSQQDKTLNTEHQNRTAEIGTELGGKEKLQGAEQTFEGTRDDRKYKFEAGENAKSRQTRLDAARISARARMAGKSGGWQWKIAKGAQKIDAKTHQVIQEPDAAVLFHPSVGVLKPTDDKLIVQGLSDEVTQGLVANKPERLASPEAVKRLFENPALAPDFAAKAGYLPIEFMKYVNQQQPNENAEVSASGPAYMMGAGGDPNSATSADEE